jgi:hypothetical protein
MLCSGRTFPYAASNINYLVSKSMTDNKDDKYIFYSKVAWTIYTLITIAIIVVLVLFVAQDNEERFFYGLMPAAAAYVFRPMNKPFSKLIFKFTGVSYPTEEK